jgi:hypothetical protein
VITQGNLSGYGEIVVHRDTIYAATNFGDDIAVIGPDLAEARVLYDGLAASWFTVPQLEFEPKSWRSWGAAGRDLARFDLRPSAQRLARANAE